MDTPCFIIGPIIVCAMSIDCIQQVYRVQGLIQDICGWGNGEHLKVPFACMQWGTGFSSQPMHLSSGADTGILEGGATTTWEQLVLQINKIFSKKGVCGHPPP